LLKKEYRKYTIDEDGITVEKKQTIQNYIQYITQNNNDLYCYRKFISPYFLSNTKEEKFLIKEEKEFCNPKVIQFMIGNLLILKKIRQ
jgi:hypothetical protein